VNWRTLVRDLEIFEKFCVDGLCPEPACHWSPLSIDIHFFGDSMFIKFDNPDPSRTSGSKAEKMKRGEENKTDSQDFARMVAEKKNPASQAATSTRVRRDVTIDSPVTTAAVGEEGGSNRHTVTTAATREEGGSPRGDSSDQGGCKQGGMPACATTQAPGKKDGKSSCAATQASCVTSLSVGTDSGKPTSVTTPEPVEDKKKPPVFTSTIFSEEGGKAQTFTSQFMAEEGGTDSGDDRSKTFVESVNGVPAVASVTDILGLLQGYRFVDNDDEDDEDEDEKEFSAFPIHGKRGSVTTFALGEEGGGTGRT
jgi:hypothetical protein